MLEIKLQGESLEISTDTLLWHKHTKGYHGAYFLGELLDVTSRKDKGLGEIQACLFRQLFTWMIVPNSFGMRWPPEIRVEGNVQEIKEFLKCVEAGLLIKSMEQQGD